MTRTSWRYGLRLIGDETGGTGFVELLMVVACVSFLVIGGVGAAAGAVLLLTAPEEKQSGPTVQAWLGAGSAGVKGSF